MMKLMFYFAIFFSISNLSLIANPVFEKNMGHFHNAEYNAANEVLFKAKFGDGEVYLTKNGFAFSVFIPEFDDFSELVPHKPVNKIKLLKSERFDIELVDGNIDLMKCELIGKQKEQINIYNPLVPNGLFGVEYYQKLIFRDVYRGIDLVIYQNMNGEFEYDFFVHPFADISQIRLKISNSIANPKANGNIELAGRISKVELQKPFSYQEEDFIKYEIASAYKLINTDEIAFAIDSYDNSQPLIIDPINIIYSTYYGGTLDQNGLAVDADSEGNVYFSGMTTSPSLVAHQGYQEIFGGMEDAYLVKKDKAGNRVWATYYGGDKYEVGFGVCSMPDGDVCLVGETGSDNVIASANSHQPDYGGFTADGFIAVFDKDGKRKWATYYGGLGEEKFQSVDSDQFGNIYAVGYTSSDNNIAFSGFQNTRGGANDMMIVKFNPLGERSWGTYYGGTGDDYANYAKVLKDGKLYVVGSSDSDNNIAHNGFQNAHGGGFDATIAIFSQAGNREWASYYGGSRADFGNAVIDDIEGSFYIAGSTQSENAISSNGFQNSLENLTDAFLVKFDKDKARKWATYYGGRANDFGYAVSFYDKFVVLSGATRSFEQIATNNARQNALSAETDAFFAMFNKEGKREYATYLGGERNDWFRDSYANQSVLYFVGSAGSANGISYQGFKNQISGVQDAILTKWGQQFITAKLETQPCRDFSFFVEYECFGLELSSANMFTVELSDSLGSFSRPVIIGRFTSTNTKGSIECSFPSNIAGSGKYAIRVVSSAPEVVSNPINDIVVPRKLAFVNLREYACPDRSTVYSANNDNFAPAGFFKYKWTIVNGIIEGADSLFNVRVKWADTRSGSLKLVRTYANCSDSIEAQIQIRPMANFELEGAMSVCDFQEYEYTFNLEPHIRYEFSVNVSLSFTQQGNKLFIYWLPNQVSTLTVYMFDSLTNCTREVKYWFNVVSRLRSETTVQGNRISCIDCIEEYNYLYGGFDYYKWSAFGGEIIGRDDSNYVSVRWKDNGGKNSLTLTVTDYRNECTFDITNTIFLPEQTDSLKIFYNKDSCFNSEVVYRVTPRENVKYIWEVEGGTIRGRLESAIIVLWNQSLAGKVKVSLFDMEDNFIDSVAIDVKLYDVPRFNVAYNRNYCIDDTLQFTFDRILNNYTIFESNGIEIIYRDSLGFVGVMKPAFLNISITAFSEEKESCSFNLNISRAFYPIVKPEVLQVGNRLRATDISFSAIWFLDGVHIPEFDGLDTIQPTISGFYSLQYRDENGCLSEISDEFYFLVTSVENLAQSGGISIYPNPNSGDKLYLSFGGDLCQDLQISVFDMLGNRFETQKELLNNAVYEIDISSLKNNGVYYLQITNCSQISTEKFIFAK